MKIGIYGTGRFGRFWAQTLSRYATVVTHNRSERPVPEGCSPASLAELGACDAVMLCVAISAVGDAVAGLVPYLAPDCAVMDTCSVKLYPTWVMERAVSSANPVIGTHPMFGPDSAASGTDGLPMVITPVRASERVTDRWVEFFSSIGLSVIRMSADDHDREAAFTQGVTHFLGRVLADMGLRRSPIATVGYRKLLEVVEQTCNDPYQLFLDLQRFNPYTLNMRADLQRSLARIMESLPDRLDSDASRPYDSDGHTDDRDATEEH